MVAEYSRLAPEYESRWSFYVQATTRETLARLSLKSGDMVLDVGCGTGALLHGLREAYPGAALAGADPVREMLKVARERLPASIELYEAWSEKLPFDDDQFDVVTCCNVFHYIHEPRVALREMSRVLRPGGQLLITDWCDDFLCCRMCNWYLSLFNKAHFKVYRERECLQLLNEQDSFKNAAIERYKISWLWGMMTANVRKCSA